MHSCRGSPQRNETRGGKLRCERGVAERVRLKQTFDRRTDELQKQHDSVRNALAEHRSKARQILTKRQNREAVYPAMASWSSSMVLITTAVRVPARQPFQAIISL
ncbi:uncharacterized protein LOC116800205 [Drosophila sechellia]|uniref:uncharacterized protein LOC116800205 n=1 Tax=Drosophila sechellia TaxID=7238 RepID=UPI0013DDB840|nr:uncharacterized protein LOC116800205 [Drosophila sechellia]